MNAPKPLRSSAFLWLAAFPLTLSVQAQAATLSWDDEGGDGQWHNKTNWTGNVLPGPGDDVQIGAQYSVSIAVSGEQSIRSLNCQGSLTITKAARLQFSADSGIAGDLTLGSVDPAHLGTLHGAVDTAPTMTIAGELNWFGGTLSGGGVFNASGGITMDGDVGKELRGPTLNNPRTASWRGKGNFAVAGKFNNIGTFTASNDGQLVFLADAPGFFNLGSFDKLGGTGTTSANVPFHNLGKVSVTSGLLELRAGGTNTGSFAIFAGSQVRFTAGTHVLEGATFSGQGVVVQDGAVLVVNGTVQAPNFQLQGRDLTGPGTLTVSRSLLWTGGTMSGAGKTEASGTLEISGAEGKILSRRTLNNRGRGTWSGGGNIGLLGGAYFANNGTFEDSADIHTFGVTGASEGTFENLGAFEKLGGGFSSTTFNTPFNNLKSVRLGTRATLVLRFGGVARNASFATEEFAAARFTGGTYVLDAVKFEGPGRLEISGGTVEVVGSVAVSNLDLSRGELTGNGVLEVSGSLDWDEGNMTGLGVTTSKGRMSLFGRIGLRERTLNNAGTATWDSRALITLSGGALLNNLAGATFTAYGGTNQTMGGEGTFVNDGTFANDPASRPAGSIINVPFQNRGAGLVSLTAAGFTFGGLFSNSARVSLQDAHAHFVRGFRQTAGELRLQNADVTGEIYQEGGDIAGSGTINGFLLVGRNTLSTLRPGRSPGIINITGDYAQGTSGALEIELAGTAPGQFDQLAVSGKATLAGTLNVLVSPEFQPAPGDSFTFLAHATRSGAFDAVNGLSLPGGRSLEVSYGPDGVTLITRDALPSAAPALSVERFGAQLTLRFPTLQGYRYRVERADTLPAQLWEPETPDLTGDGAVASQALTIPATQPQRFFRLLQTQPGP